MRKTSLLIFSLLLIFIAGCAATGPRDGGFFTINNSGNSLRLPLEVMQDATVVTAAGLSVIFSDGSSLWVNSLLSNELGLDLDIRDYPAYLLGLRDLEQVGGLSDADIEEMLAARELLFSNDSSRIVQFDTVQGQAYGVLSPGETFLFLVLPENDRAITEIYIAGEGVHALSESVIEGVRK